MNDHTGREGTRGRPGQGNKKKPNTPKPLKPRQPQHVGEKKLLGCCIQAHTWQEPNVLLSTARSRPKQATHYQLSEGVRHANKHANTQGPKIT